MARDRKRGSTTGDGRSVETRPQREVSPRLGVLKRLAPFLWRHRLLLLTSLLLLPLMSAAQLVQPYLVRLAIDEHLTPAVEGGEADFAGLWMLVGVYVAVLAADLVLRFLQIYLMQLGGQRIMHDLRRAIFSHIQSLSMSFFDRNPVGRIMTRVTSDVETLNELVSQGIVAMARDLVTLVGIVGVMLWIDWRLALASFVVLPLLVAILALLRVRLREAYDRSRTLVARVNAFLQESITGMEIVQAFHQEERSRREFSELRNDLLAIEVKGVRFSSYLSASVQAATTISTAVVLAYGGFGILGGALTIGILVQFLEYLRRFYQPLEDLSDKYDALQRAAASCTKIFRLLDVEPEVRDPDDPRPVPDLTAGIEFDGVDFAYLEVPATIDGEGMDAAGRAPLRFDRSDDRRGPTVLRDVDLSIRPGEKVALVGATGAGKSSVVKLLQRFYDVQEGSIAIDGVDVREVAQRDLRRCFGTVPQDVFLFTDTIAANIGLGSDEVSREKIEEAARVVEAHRFVRDLPDGYDTRLGERGSSLSFGERQLLAFARAVAFDPPVLILDEATSSVDSETETRIQRALRRVIADRTAIIVAHRLSTIREVDRIVVLHHGEVRETGTHRELLERDGIYATLYRLQFEEQARTSAD